MDEPLEGRPRTSSVSGGDTIHEGVGSPGRIRRRSASPRLCGSTRSDTRHPKRRCAIVTQTHKHTNTCFIATRARAISPDGPGKRSTRRAGSGRFFSMRALLRRARLRIARRVLVLCFFFCCLIVRRLEPRPRRCARATARRDPTSRRRWDEPRRAPRDAARRVEGGHGSALGALLAGNEPSRGRKETQEHVASARQRVVRGFLHERRHRLGEFGAFGVDARRRCAARPPPRRRAAVAPANAPVSSDSDRRDGALVVRWPSSSTRPGSRPRTRSPGWG